MRLATGGILPQGRARPAQQRQRLVPGRRHVRSQSIVGGVAFIAVGIYVTFVGIPGWLRR